MENNNQIKITPIADLDDRGAALARGKFLTRVELEFNDMYEIQLNEGKIISKENPKPQRWEHRFENR